ncbi:MAG: ATP-grasp domain-containing protein [Oceanospirillaceae bacterium]|nr:ATP-grasp domain-containing protein [Oceanospirillaceae bacterium]
MIKKNILVFPCGSEVGLEIFRSLEHSIHFNLIGANSVDDHGKFVFKNYIGNIPFATEANFIDEMCKIVSEKKIDAIYPAMDSVIAILKQNEEKLGCTVISSDVETTEICLSKSKTYTKLQGIVKVPGTFSRLDEVDSYPVFLKPDIGYGSRGALMSSSREESEQHIAKYPNTLICEFLSGREYTIDCFTDFNGDLLFFGPRQRKRISNGISVNTSTMSERTRFREIAKKINDKLSFNGAWFFQVKENEERELILLEVASRMGGSSAVYRAKGINFASLSVFNAFKMPVSILENPYEVEMDRALNNRYKLNISFQHIYVDFDDTLIVDEKVNSRLIGVLYEFLNEGKKLYLITKHTHDIHESLKKYRLDGLFDIIYHLDPSDIKSKFIAHEDAIFIDDSFSERKGILKSLDLPVFSVDMIETLEN